MIKLPERDFHQRSSLTTPNTITTRQTSHTANQSHASTITYALVLKTVENRFQAIEHRLATFSIHMNCIETLCHPTLPTYICGKKWLDGILS